MDLTPFINLGGFIGLLTYIVWQDWRQGRLKFGKDSNGNGYKSLSSQMTQLQQHYNHDTTKILEEIRDDQKKSNDMLSRHMIVEETFQTELRDFIRESRRK